MTRNRQDVLCEVGVIVCLIALMMVWGGWYVLRLFIAWFIITIIAGLAWYLLLTGRRDE